MSWTKPCPERKFSVDPWSNPISGFALQVLHNYVSEPVYDGASQTMPKVTNEQKK